ncbi:MAG: hypothetical protein U1E02_01145 [Hydrogenophaga sp.]|jgi:hypothetical protein|nr:hypothetical protein [Hydrogenophaga sp.]MDO8888820.1 hypothetical protein [Hydrogenophaga sp.]MDO9133393.1 hypothetical protein [Hydrogenophaga sp.]MDO9505727.1 hypothetical protein [Hydrogenophaga sp.]MDP1686051.1 hypothetical protein [Hydrogenophaga sp.]MDP1780636.1 hypothetical protein [Hydrogenophaga sp.]
MSNLSTNYHPWIGSLQVELDALEAALLRGDAPAVELASAAMQKVLMQAPPVIALGEPGSDQQQALLSAAERFARLRQAVLRANAQSQRAVTSLLPQHAMQPTYGRQVGASSMGGAGRGYLSA